MLTRAAPCPDKLGKISFVAWTSSYRRTSTDLDSTIGAPCTASFAPTRLQRDAKYPPIGLTYRYKRYDKPVKKIFLYPLINTFRKLLAGDPDGFTE
jgi:hypothetical protein